MAEPLRKTLPYVAVSAVALAIAAVALQLWRADFTIPFYYAVGSDAFDVVSLIKIIAETGWVDQSANLGMPFGAEFYGYPSTSGFHQAVIWLMLRVFHNPAVVLNAYYLLFFPLSAAAAMFVFRRFGVSRWSAATFSVLFAFLPYRFFRNEAHLFYSSYFLVPFAVMVALWLARGDRLFESPKEPRRNPLPRITPKGWSALAVCLLLACDNPYHTFFLVVLLLGAGAIALVRSRQFIASMAPMVVLIATIAFGFALNFLPTAAYNRNHTEKGYAFHRAPIEAQMFSLTLAQMLLPIQHHRIPGLAGLREKFDRNALAINENSSASLGTIGALGFLLLACWLVLRPYARKMQSCLFDDLASLSAVAFALGTYGGIGTLVALYLSDSLHAYNRITPFIDFFALFAVAICFDRVTARLRNRPAGRAVVVFAAVAVVALGVIDQTNAATVPPYAADVASYTSMQRFTASIEASLPHGASIFQLPVIAFPEGEGRYPRVLPSEELEPFLHSGSLRWSYGSFKESPSGRYQIAAANGTSQQLAFYLALGGFDGVLIDRNGYDDAAADLERDLRSIAATAPIGSEDGKWIFFNLTNYAAGLRERLGPARFAYARQLVLHPPEIEWRSGCYFPQDKPGEVWRWCGHDAVLAIVNDKDAPRTFHLAMSLATRDVTPARFTIESPSGNTVLTASPSGTPYSSTIVLSPKGTALVHIHTDGLEIPVQGDPRTLVFQIIDPSLQETNDLATLLRDYGEPRKR